MISNNLTTVTYMEAILSAKLENLKPWIYVILVVILIVIFSCITKLAQILINCYCKHYRRVLRGNDIIRIVEIMRDRSIDTLHDDFPMLGAGGAGSTRAGRPTK